MKIFGFSVEECLTFFMLVVVGYFIAKLFSQKCNGFSVGAQINCEGITNLESCRRHRIHGCEVENGTCGWKACDNPNQKPPNCSTCQNTSLQYPDCDTCINPLHGGPNCNTCLNASLLYPDCNICINGSEFQPPNCDELKDCNQLNETNCSFNTSCVIDDIIGCIDKEKNKLNAECAEDTECQSGVCHHEDGQPRSTCRKCSEVSELLCTSYHNDVCDFGGTPKACRYRPCTVRNNIVDSCSTLDSKICNSSRNINNELCHLEGNICTNQKTNGEILKCKP